MHPILFSEQTILNDSTNYQVCPDDLPFFAVRGDSAPYTIFLPNSKDVRDGYTVAIHNQTTNSCPKSIDVASGSGDTVVNQSLPFPIYQGNEIYVYRLNKPSKQWIPLLVYYPGNVG